MSRIPTPTLDTATGATAEVYAQINKAARKVPNTFDTNLLTRSGLLREDLDYHLVRASMVIIFLFFGYQKWFEYEAQVLIPYISNGPLIFWMYPVFGIRGGQLVPGRRGMVVRRAPVPRILGQAAGDPRGGWFDRHLRDDRHHHSIHAEWLGRVCRRLSRNDR
jgi:hypothetical protein